MSKALKRVVVTGGAYGLEDGTKIKVGAEGDDEKEKSAAGKSGDGDDK